MTRLGDLLRDARAARGLDLEEVGRQVGLPVETLEDLEAGRVERPSFGVLEPLAYLYGTSLGELVRHSGHYSPQAARPGEVACLRTRDGRRDAVLAALRDFVTARVSTEPGTLAFSWHVSVADPDALWLYELFDGMSGLVAHMDSAEHRELKLRIGPDIVSADLEFFELSFDRTGGPAPVAGAPAR